VDIDIKELNYKGVAVQSDLCLYERGRDDNHNLMLLSIYGTAQQVKAIFSAIASFNCVSVASGGMTISRAHQSVIHGRGTGIGYGKQHFLIWDDSIETDAAVWFKKEGKEGEKTALKTFLDGRKVPYEDGFLGFIKKALIKDKDACKLGGWGCLEGYMLDFEDDDLCNEIVQGL